MPPSRMLIALGIGVLVVETAAAQTVGIGTTKAGAPPVIAATIAKVVSQHSGGIQMRTQAYSGTQQYVPVVNFGKLEFGVSNVVQLRFSIEGKILSKGHPHPNLQLVATLMPFRAGFMVKDDSPVRALSDLRGKRVAGGFNPQPLVRLLHQGYLANGGLTYDDVNVVASSGFLDHWNQFMQGKIEGFTVGLGTAKAKEIEAKVGRLRFVPLDDSAQAVAALQRYLPGAYVAVAQKAAGIPGLDRPTKVLSFDYSLWTGKHVAADIVYRSVKALYENAEELKAAGGHWRLFDRANMARDQGVPYHPAAARYFKEIGLTGS